MITSSGSDTNRVEHTQVYEEVKVIRVLWILSMNMIMRNVPAGCRWRLVIKMAVCKGGVQTGSCG